MKVSIGSRIKLLRESVGMSGRELCRVAGLSSEKHVWTLEKDPRGAMTVATAVAIAKVFGCSLDWMILGVGKAPSPRGVRARAELARKAA